MPLFESFPSQEPGKMVLYVVFWADNEIVSIIAIRNIGRRKALFI
jgi:hypothetical protein